MVNLKHALSFGLFLPALILIGCEGQNTLKRNTNPVKDYQGAIDKSQPWKPGMGKRAPVVDADNSAFYCTSPFSISLVGETGHNHLRFQAGAESAYEIRVNAGKRTDFTVTAENGPKGLTVRPLKEGSTYQLVWKPSREDNKHETVKIVITDKQIEEDCNFGFAQPINLDVDAGPGAPVLSLIGLPTTAIEYGPWKEFQIEMIDPVATPDKAPVITSTGVDARAVANSEAKPRNVSAEGAVTCPAFTMKSPGNATVWTTTCQFHPELLKDVESFIKNPQTVNAVFLVKAKSSVSGLEASETSGSFQVRFPEVPKPDNAKKDEQIVALAAGEMPKVGPRVAIKPVVKPKAVDHKAKPADHKAKPAPVKKAVVHKTSTKNSKKTKSGEDKTSTSKPVTQKTASEKTKSKTTAETPAEKPATKAPVKTETKTEPSVGAV